MELADIDRRRADADSEAREVLDEMREAEAALAGIERKRQVLEQEAEIKEASREHLRGEDREDR